MNKILTLLTTILFTTTALAADLRIVSVGGGATETIAALGGEKFLVGVDTSSTYPPEVTKLPQVGYQRTLAPEGILALTPTDVIVTADAGPPTTLKHIEDAGVKVTVLPSAPTITTVKKRLDEVAALLKQQAKADTLWQKVENDLTTAKDEQKNITKRKEVLFLLVVPGSAPLIAGRDTEADAMIALAGGKNIVTEFTGYKVVTPEAMQKLNPDVILITDEGLTAVGGKDQLWQIPGLMHTKAASKKAVIAMDAGFLLNFGPRTGTAVLQLTRELRSAPN